MATDIFSSPKNSIPYCGTSSAPFFAILGSFYPARRGLSNAPSCIANDALLATLWPIYCIFPLSTISLPARPIPFCLTRFQVRCKALLRGFKMSLLPTNSMQFLAHNLISHFTPDPSIYTSLPCNDLSKLTKLLS